MSVLEKHQGKRALAQDAKIGANVIRSCQSDNSTASCILYEETALSNLDKLKSADYPFRLNQGVLRKITKLEKYWFHTVAFFKDANDQIFCKGTVLSKHYITDEDGKLVPKKHNNLFALDRCESIKYIRFSDLHHSNEFLYTHQNEDPNIAGWLLEWMNS